MEWPIVLFMNARTTEKRNPVEEAPSAVQEGVGKKNSGVYSGIFYWRALHRDGTAIAEST